MFEEEKRRATTFVGIEEEEKKLKRDLEIDKMFISFQSSFSSTRAGDVTVVGHWSTCTVVLLL